MGHRQHEPRNATGLIYKLRIIVAVQDLKISFYMQILIPPYFWLVPPHFVCSGDGTGPPALKTNELLLNQLAVLQQLIEDETMRDCYCL